jgi:hypothetical protein
MASESGSSRHGQDKALAPIRWPHPGWKTLSLIGLWMVGGLLAVFVPALIVPPTAGRAPTGEVLAALSCTLAGAAVMAGVGFTFLRRHEDPVALAFGVVPAITVTIGGLIMAATKLTGA